MGGRPGAPPRGARPGRGADAQDLARFLAREGLRRFDDVPQPRVIAGPALTSESLRSAFDELKQPPRVIGRPRPWGPGDELIVVLEAHVLAWQGDHFVLG